MESKILDLLCNREIAYLHATDEIFKLFSDKLSDAVNFFMKRDSIVYWDKIDLLAGFTKFVHVIGYVLPIIGDTLLIGEETIRVTKDNLKEYKQMVRFLLPVELLEAGTKMQLYAFMRDMSEILTVATNEDLEELLQEYEFNGSLELTDTDKYYKLLDKLTKPTDIMGFDGHNLSDDQIKKIYSYGSVVTTDTKH